MPVASELVARILQIVLIDLVLSGDNAVVIGMAAHPLPGRQRRLAILIGGGAALALRVALTAIAALLLEIPALKLVGGLLLLWIAYRLLEVENDSDTKRAPTTLRGAVATILLADFVMSLDNVLGVAAASDGDVPLLLVGLAISMAIVIFGGSVVAALLDRLWWLAYVGALVIAWTGADLIQDDVLVSQAADIIPPLVQILVSAFVSVLVVVVAHRAHRAHRLHQRPSSASR
jgi:YjbE family integral membrane protein